jgi:hypothetical protein
MRNEIPGRDELDAHIPAGTFLRDGEYDAVRSIIFLAGGTVQPVRDGVMVFYSADLEIVIASRNRIGREIPTSSGATDFID